MLDISRLPIIKSPWGSLWPLWALVICLLPLGVVLMLSDRAFDRQLFLMINHTGYQALSGSGQLLWNWSFYMITQLGDTHVMLWCVFLVNLSWWLRRGRVNMALCYQCFLVLTIALLIASLSSFLLKSWFAAFRPAAVLDMEQLHILGPTLYHRAFPSGHTTTVFAGATILWPMINSKMGRVMVMILAIVTGLSRISVGAHWPVDVIGGVALGVMAGTLGWWIAYRLIPCDNQKTLSKPVKWLCWFGMALMLVNILITPFYPLPYLSVRLWGIAAALMVIGVCYYRTKKNQFHKTFFEDETETHNTHKEN